MSNDQYSNRFISKANGQMLYDAWKSHALAVRNTGHNFNAIDADPNATAEAKAEAKTAFYSALSAVFSAIGNIPTADGQQGKKLVCDPEMDADGRPLNGTMQAFIRSACTDWGRIEKDSVTDARKARAEIMKQRDTEVKEMQKKLFAKNGNAYNGVSAIAIANYAQTVEEYAEKVKTADANITKLLNKSGNSVFAYVPTPDSRFLKEFEKHIRKAVCGQNLKTLAQIKAERAERNKKTAEQRKDNAKKTDSKKTAGKSKTKTESK
jgi:hypothetical protein